MGVIEAQTRGQMAALERQMAEQQRDLDQQAKEAADALERELGKIKPEDIRVNVHWDADPFPYPDPNRTYIPGHASGGVFYDEHLARIAEGGRPEIIGDMDFMTQALVRAINRVGPTSATGHGGDVVVQMTIVAPDGRYIGEQVERIGRDALRHGVWAVPARNITQRGS